jgi:hypothetical protein
MLTDSINRTAYCGGRFVSDPCCSYSNQIGTLTVVCIVNMSIVRKRMSLSFDVYEVPTEMNHGAPIQYSAPTMTLHHNP